MIDKLVNNSLGSQRIAAKRPQGLGDPDIVCAGAKHSDNQKAPLQNYPLIERRSGKDRRQRNSCRGRYDMRHSAGRRTTDRQYPSIETDV